MDFTANTKELVRLFARAASAASDKSPTDALTSICLIADGDRLTARATDLFVGSEASVAANVKAAGSVCIKAKRAVELVKAMPAGDVRIRVVRNQVEITAQTQTKKPSFKVNFIPGEDFPALPTMGEQKCATVEAKEFGRALAQGAYAMAEDDTNPDRYACLLEMEKANVRAVSTDGNRFAYSECAIEGEVPKMLVPARGLAEVKALCAAVKDGSIGISSAGGYAFFKAPDGILSVKLLDMPFAPYRRLNLPERKEVTVLRTALIDAVHRASLDEMPPTGPEVGLYFEEGAMRVESARGNAQDVVECACAFETKVNARPKFLLATLAAIRDDEVTVGVSGPKDPLVITPASSLECFSLMMPLSPDR